MRILATSQPAIGHLNPVLPLLRALHEAGHEVRVATAASAAPWVTAAGLPSVAAGLDWLETRYADTFPEVVALRGDPPALQAFLMDVFTRRTASAMAGDLRRLFTDWRPDLVLHEKSELGGAAAAAGAGITHLPLWYSANDWQTMFVPHLAGTDEALAAAGAPPQGGDAAWLTADGAVLIEPPGWTSVPPGVEVWRVRPQLFEATVATAARPASWYEALPRPLVLVTLGTVFNKRPGLFDPLIAGARELAGTVLVAAGPGAEVPARPGVVVADFLPLSEALPHCDAVVAHAGYGTVVGCAATGTPMVALVIGADHAFNAAPAQAAGWAVPIRSELPEPAAVSRALSAALSEPSRAAAARQRAELERLPTAAEVAGALADRFRPGRA